MDLNQFLGIIRNMDRRPFKPHRYLALLAIFDIIENKEDRQNTFFYDDDFKNYFTKYFNNYHGPNDENRPFKPFFHLKNAGEFWFLGPKPGKELELQCLHGINGSGQLNEIVEYAKLDQELFDLLSNKKSGQESREIVRNIIKQCLMAGLRIDC